MAKWQNDSMLDAALDYVADNADLLHVCSDPAGYTYAQIVTATLASVALTVGDGNGDYTIGNGDTNGRKLAIAEQADIEITASGTATHIALTNGTDTLYYVTTCTSQALVDNDVNTVTVPTWDIEIADAT